MSEMLRFARRSVQASLHACRVTSAVAATRWRRERLLILCYHGLSIADEHEWDPELFVTQDFLRTRFQALRQHSYNVLPLADAVERLQAGSLPARSVVLTFDDALYDFYARALPVLEEFDYPATVYVPTYHVRNQRPVPLLAAQFMAWRALKLRPKGVHWHGRELSSTDLGPGGWANAEMQAMVMANMTDHDAEEQWLRDLARDLEIDWQEFVSQRLFHLMTATELQDAARRGVDMQLHTHRHRTPRERNLFVREIEDNRRYLYEMLGERADHLCYPSGDFDPVFFPWLEELGVRTATTCEPGLATASSPPLLLPRFIDTMSQSGATFHCWLSGIASLMRR
jgi:peptidoglycan/xylan/chitin deacetylase (PgdA/CDA1 family)